MSTKFLRFIRYLLIAAATVTAVTACPDPIDGPDTPEQQNDIDSTNNISGITYQLLVYSFADSDGDGVGDFKGIENRLDYLSQMGVQALWLSPIHPATSYHGYDVEDYGAVNPDYGTEDDFKALVSAAHAKNIKIYIDYVLNHSSKNHPWFLEGRQGSDSKYWDYYNFSNSSRTGWSSTVVGDNPGKVKVKFTLTSDSKGTPQTLQADLVDEIVNTGEPGSGKYLWYGTVKESTMPEFYSDGNNVYTLSLEMETSWGVLVRTSRTEWGSAKYGASSADAQTLSWGSTLKLKSGSDLDVLMPWMKPVWYQSVFGSYMPDLNYGPAASCEQSGAFKDVCAAADKWIEMGVDGFRLDAVKHIYDNDASDENPTFLQKFYEHCNATFKAVGHTGDIYMVGEQWSEPDQVAPYYKGLNAFFEFAFWWRFKECVSSGTGSTFAPSIADYHGKYAAVRTDAVAATKLSNHDENRAATDLSKVDGRVRLAAAVLLTCGGEPYIYQGEELGYYGNKSNGDQYVRTPMMWNADGSYLADVKLGALIDRSMLNAGISVENQSADETSLLSLYRRFGKLRQSYKALGQGGMTAVSMQSQSLSAWYREYDGQRILAVHNFSPSTVTENLNSTDLTKMIGSNGAVTVSGTRLTLGPYASVLFLVNQKLLYE